MHYLVDSENIGYVGLKGVEYLFETDVVVILYTTNNVNIITSIRGYCAGSPAKVVCMQVPTGTQSLDMNLACITGMLVANGVKEITIVARDKGYTRLQALLENLGVSILYKPFIGADTLFNHVSPDAQAILSELPIERRAEVYTLLCICSNRQDFFTSLRIQGEPRKLLRKMIPVNQYSEFRRLVCGIS